MMRIAITKRDTLAKLYTFTKSWLLIIVEIIQRTGNISDFEWAIFGHQETIVLSQ